MQIIVQWSAEWDPEATVTKMRYPVQRRFKMPDHLAWPIRSRLASRDSPATLKFPGIVAARNRLEIESLPYRQLVCTPATERLSREWVQASHV